MEAQKGTCGVVLTHKCGSALFDIAVVKVINTERVKHSRENTCVSEADRKRNT